MARAIAASLEDISLDQKFDEADIQHFASTTSEEDDETLEVIIPKTRTNSSHFSQLSSCIIPETLTVNSSAIMGSSIVTTSSPRVVGVQNSSVVLTELDLSDFYLSIEESERVWNRLNDPSSEEDVEESGDDDMHD